MSETKSKTYNELQIELLELELKKRQEARSHFATYLDYSSQNYQRKWFHTLVADKCQALLEGTLGKDRLMVFMPPQHGKSEVVSRKLATWAFGNYPKLKIVGASYSADLSEKFSLAIQRTMDEEFYHNLFPQTRISKKGENSGYIRNSDFFEIIGTGGFYKSVGVGGGLTGTSVDIGIIDDPVKDAMEAYSTTYRERVWNWYTDVFLTRLHNNSKQLFIMTRWHDDDLAGRLLKKEADKWEVISIPAIKENNDNELDHREIGEALWEQMHSLQQLQEQQHRSPRTFSALYQQHPSVEGGNIVKRDWFKRISQAEFNSLRFNEPIHFYLDTAYNKKKEKVDNDPSGILGACKIGNNIYIVGAQKVYKEMPDLLRYLPVFMASNKGSVTESILHVEPKANGLSVIQMLQEFTNLNVKNTPSPTDSKEARFRAVSPRIECGRVYLVEGEWNEVFLDELCAFPSAPHDEFVDILGYAINDLINEDDFDYSIFDKADFGL